MKYDINTFTEIEVCELVNKKIESRDLEEALEILINYVDKKTSHRTLTLLGYFYLRIGEPNRGRWYLKSDKAISILEQAVLLEPLYYTYSLLGEAYIKQNMYAQAEEVLKVALKINNKYEINNNLGVALFMQGKNKEACKYFYTAHLQRSDKKYYYYPYLNYGICLATNNNINDSLEVVEQLIKLEKNDLLGEIDLIDISRVFYFTNNYQKVEDIISDALHYYVLGYDDFIIYGHSLLEINNVDQFTLTLDNICEDKEEAIEEILKDIDIADLDKQSDIIALKEQIQKYKNIYNSILQGAIPNLSKAVYLEEAKYLLEWLYQEK